MDIKQKNSRYAGFLLTEAIASLALLGLLLIMVAQFEYRAAAATRSLEQEYMATVAAESQFERLKTGLDVLDPVTFDRKYPGLNLDFHLQPSKQDGIRTGVVTITVQKPKPRTLIQLTGPVSPFISQSGEKK